MKFEICFVALALCCVSSSPAPQLFGNYQPFTPIGTWFQNFQNAIRAPLFPNGFLNQYRPGQIAPTQPVPIQSIPNQQVIPSQPQIIDVPNPQVDINSNGWFWQNWIPLPIIPQYGQDGPTIVIVSRPSSQSKPSTPQHPDSIAAKPDTPMASLNSNSTSTINTTNVSSSAPASNLSPIISENSSSTTQSTLASNPGKNQMKQ